MILCNECNEFLETSQKTIIVRKNTLIKYALICKKCQKESFSIILQPENITNIEQAIHQGYLSLNNQNHFKQMNTICPQCHNKSVIELNGLKDFFD